MRRWRLPRLFFTFFFINAFDSPGGWFVLDVAAMDTPEVGVPKGLLPYIKDRP